MSFVEIGSIPDSLSLHDLIQHQSFFFTVLRNFQVASYLVRHIFRSALFKVINKGIGGQVNAKR